ncbi:MAG: ribosomal RNA small subunit methyltransferase A [Candidatus Buchananbacteria bacterium RBG_13_36_9]|uniref:Ribosomal RNA small subunit methyltransferase A n=1 Tax=Candidatus Buchananbacteria bacterium RBG_13_36_9 TaxID=1797530 RepID=A0A1G1XRK8_9BACT|nr:MAG: ribosomal RNA small subunit methyltransferase A [Candidatus Buchananbacteria bacterium RBG_13_36_9]
MTINEIKYLLNQYGIRPSKAKGQNFLINQNVLQKIVAAAQLKKEGNVLEIGPGLGILTEELIKYSQNVLAVELDKRLLFFLKQKFKAPKNLEILEADILKIKNADLVKNFVDSKDYKVVANLPYNITKPILRKFLSYQPKPSVLVILVQKEVAEKICAKPGEMSLLSLTVQFYGQPEIIGYVGKQNFYPQPKVDSAILRIKSYPQNLPPDLVKKPALLAGFEEKKFWQLVKLGYSSPRKQLHNNLAAGLKIPNSEIKIALKTAKLNEKIRAEELALTDWFILYQQLMV